MIESKQAVDETEALRVLVVDDEPRIVSLLRLILRYEGFSVAVAEDGPGALREAAQFKPHLVLLDLMLPGIDGMDVAAKLRGDPDLLIIMVTARDAVQNIVAGLKGGGDDYIVKPFDSEELVARVHALVRRRRPAQAQILHAGPIVLDQKRRMVTVDGSVISLTLREYELLSLFVRNPRQVLTRQIILDRVWGYDFYGDENNVEVYIGYLRRKLGDARHLIETIRGVGYCLNV